MPSRARRVTRAFDLRMSNAAQGRVSNYRLQAAHFQEMAQTESNEKLRTNLLRLAEEYEELAASLAVSEQKRDGD